MEAGESPEEGIAREVKEEIGLDCKVGPLLGIYEFIQMNQIIIAYDVFLSQGEIKLDKEELVDFKLVSSSELRPWPSGTGQAVKKWLHQRGIENKEIEFEKLKLTFLTFSCFTNEKRNHDQCNGNDHIVLNHKSKYWRDAT
jgi:NADH pyrophosphatase NudC (nudix superfamily)